MFRCPGQDTRLWKADDVSEEQCPQCGSAVEFWKDDTRRRCPHCGALVRNPKVELGCAKWCKYATECVGSVPMINEAEETICDRLIAAMKEVFGTDQRRITHALRVLNYAEDILTEENASPLVVRAAAILHDIGILEAERKHGSSAGKYQELEGSPIARRIMQDVGLDEPTIQHVCRIVGSHHSGMDIDTPEFRIVWDADWLVNIPEELPRASKKELRKITERVFRTRRGMELGKELFLEGEEGRRGGLEG